MNDSGYIKMYRKLQDWKWFQEPKTLQLFLYFLLNANYVEKNWQGITVMPGQLITSLHSISLATGQTIQSIRTATDRLKSTHEITSKTTNKFSLITIVNWALYQSAEDITTSNATFDPTNEQQTNNKQTTTTKKYKEYIRNKEYKEQIYYDNSELNKAFISYIEMRKKIKSPLTDHAIDLAQKKLTCLAKNDDYLKIEIINQSVLNSWKGLFPYTGDVNRPKEEQVPKSEEPEQGSFIFNIEEYMRENKKGELDEIGKPKSENRKNNIAGNNG